LPLIRGDDDGWFEIHKLSVDEREISGQVRINALNKAKVHIDRTTGMIDIGNSHGSFSGECDVQDVSRRRF
jgi:hypothetical protein